MLRQDLIDQIGAAGIVPVGHLVNGIHDLVHQYKAVNAFSHLDHPLSL